MHIFDKEQLEKANFILDNPCARLSGLLSSEIKELAVAWCYYSGKIEGNTYTYVETEALLKDGITSEKKYEDARMLKNLYNIFIGELDYIHRDKNKEMIDERTLFRIHANISSGLVSNEDSGNYRQRAVAIRGTVYMSPKDNFSIRQEMNRILFEQDSISNPLERAVFLHCNIAKTQPFIDGNKRTSRLVESICLMNADIIPVYSANESDIVAYRKALVEFYETDNYKRYADYFLNRQIERINEIAPPKFQYSNNGGFSR